MSKCKCDLRTKLVGDGCRYCNPQEYIDKLIDSIDEQCALEGLTNDEVSEIWQSAVSLEDAIYLTQAKLIEKNT